MTRMTPLADRVLALTCCLSIAACAGTLVRPATPVTRPRTEALLVLPGFGYGRSGERVFRSLAAPMAAEGLELFVPTYIARGGLAKSRSNLERFIREQRLDRYERLHVFAFIAGAWTFNPMVELSALPNLTTVVYDRSPYQERAPRIADQALHFRAWLRFGSPLFDVARTPYPPLTAPHVKVGIAVETVPTAFVKDHEQLARSYGPFHFECAAFVQRYDDCMYLSLSHDDLYEKFATVWPDLLAFIKQGHFTEAATRTPPAGDPLAEAQRP